MTALSPAEQMLFDALEALAPLTLLAVGRDGAVEAYLAAHPECRAVGVGSIHELRPLGGGERRFRAGVIASLHALTDQDARQLIAALRDRFCEVVLIPVPRSHWTFGEYLGLGFELRASCANGAAQWVLYLFDVDRYNPEREWNNPVDWAHPENFDRFRW